MQSKEKRPCLYLSFWDICLENFPTGIISHTILSPEEAKSLITQAKKKKRLFCVASGKKSTDRERLCGALRTRWSMDISEKDFLHKWGTKKEFELEIFPLNAVKMEGKEQFLVITNLYVFGKREKKKMQFDIAPDTIEFHLFKKMEVKTS